MVYCDGFSQFLQMKNDLPVTPYYIITNYYQILVFLGDIYKIQIIFMD